MSEASIASFLGIRFDGSFVYEGFPRLANYTILSGPAQGASFCLKGDHTLDDVRAKMLHKETEFINHGKAT